MNNLRQIKKVIYRLKRTYGRKITFRFVEVGSVNILTGEQTVTNHDYVINRAIILPRTISRDFTYDLAFIAANKNFTYGGYYDPSKHNVLVDSRDLTTLLATYGKIDPNWDAIIGDQVFKVKSADPYDNDLAYLITLTTVESQA